MAKLPSNVDFGVRPTPQARRAIVPVRTGQVEAAQVEEGRAISRAGQTVFDFGGDLAQAQSAERARNQVIQQRIQTREDAVETVRGYSTYNNELNTEDLRLGTEGDISKQQTVTDFVNFSAERKADILANYTGSEESKLLLSARLEAIQSAAINRMGVKSAQASNALVVGVLGNEINALAANAIKDPASLSKIFGSLDSTLTGMGGALSPAQQREFRNSGREAIASAAIGSFLARGDIEGAEAFAASPSVHSVLRGAAQLRIRQQIAGARAEETKFLREAKGKLAAAEFLKGGPLTPGERLELADIARVPPQKKDEFNRNLDEMMRMEAEGLQDTPRYKILAQRVERQTQSTQEGLSIQFNPDGTVSAITQGPAAGLGSGLSASKALAQKANVDRFSTVIDILDITIGQIQESPTRAGISGSVRSFAQKIVGVSSDIAPDALAEAVGSAAKRFGLGSFFDPALPESEIYENTIALELAKLRVTAGGGGIRAVASAFKAAKQDVALRGLTSSQEVLTRLQTVRREFDTERSKLMQRLSGTPTVGTFVEGQTATNPATKETIIFRNGRWEPVAGKPASELRTKGAPVSIDGAKVQEIDQAPARP